MILEGRTHASFQHSFNRHSTVLLICLHTPSRKCITCPPHTSFRSVDSMCEFARIGCKAGQRGRDETEAVANLQHGVATSFQMQAMEMGRGSRQAYRRRRKHVELIMYGRRWKGALLGYDPGECLQEVFRGVPPRMAAANLLNVFPRKYAKSRLPQIKGGRPRKHSPETLLWNPSRGRYQTQRGCTMRERHIAALGPTSPHPRIFCLHDLHPLYLTLPITCVSLLSACLSLSA